MDITVSKVLLLLLILSISVLGFWGFKLLQLSGQESAYAKYWSEPRGEKGGIVYVALGDSAAQGIGASTPEKGYVGLVADQIRTETKRGVLVINLSKTGAKIDDVIRDQLPLLSNYRPDIITIGIGGNDIRSYSKMQYANSVIKLTSLLPEGTIIADNPYFMHGRWEKYSVEAANVIETHAKANKLTVANLHHTMLSRGWKSMLYDFAADWFHPNDSGYKVWAQAFAPAVTEKIKNDNFANPGKLIK